MKIRRIAAWICTLFLSIQAFSYGGPNPVKTAPIQKQALKRIIIDAGHGGGDVGARGRYSTEKDISLAVLAGQLDSNTKYLSEIINTHYNVNFNTYINKLRINYIIEKLKTDPNFINYKIFP